MKNQSTPSKALGAALLVLSAALLVGMLTFAAPCGRNAEGAWMTCHWAGQAELGVAAVLVFCSLMRLLAGSAPMRKGLSLAIAALGVLAAVVPGGLIDLCMMETMQCHTVMRPVAMIAGIAIALAALADIFAVQKSSQSS